MIKKEKFTFVYFVCLFLLVLGFCFSGIPHFVGVSASDNYEKFSDALETMRTFESESAKISKDEFYVKDENLYLKSDLADLYGLNEIETDENGFALVDAKAVISEDEAILEDFPSNNRLIVVYEGDVPDFDAVLKAEYEEFHIFQYENSEKMQDAYRQLTNSNFDVSYDYKIKALDEKVESESLFTYNSWGDKYVGFGEYTENMLKIHPEDTLNEVVVAVFDSGIYSGHELFKNRIHRLGANFTTEKSSTGYAYEDMFGHGTHVSGIIANSTLSNVKILPLKILNKDGDGQISYIIQAVKYLKAHKSDIPNLKLANLSVGIERQSTTESAIDKSLMNAIQDLFDNDILPVVSAGNDAVSTELACPANVYDAITVSALRKSLLIPSQKETVEFAYSYSNFGPHVDFCAPGSDILSAGISSKNSYVKMSGTSMAAPHVTAAYALIFSNPDYDAYSKDDVTQLLEQNAVSVDSLNQNNLFEDIFGSNSLSRNDYYGYGVINISKIGVFSDGYVQFENVSTDSNVAKVKLSYPVSVGQKVNIYYSLDETVQVVDQSCTLYKENSVIELNKTTKISAVAYVSNNLNQVVKMSFVTSQVFQFNNIDLQSNFEFENGNAQGVLLKYNGDFKVLNLSNMTLSGIASGAFSGTGVEEITLPTTIKTISSSAFERNLSLKKISGTSKVSIGSRAFYECRNLTDFDMENATSIGELAFAYTQNLKKLTLPNAVSIGKNALSGSGVQTLILGINSSIQDHKIGENNLKNIYGYAQTNVDEFALRHDVKFNDLTLKVVSDFSESLILKPEDCDGGVFKITTVCNIYGDSYKILIDGKDFSTTYGTYSCKNLDLQTKEIEIQLNLMNLTRQEHTLQVLFEDKFGNETSTKISNLKILPTTAKTFTLRMNGYNYSLYVNGELYNGQKLYQGETYKYEIKAKDGYVLTGDVAVNSVIQNGYAFDYVNNNDEMIIEAQTDVLEKLSVNFNGFEACEISVFEGNDYVLLKENNYIVSRGNEFKFKVNGKDGYEVYGVYLNDEKLEATDGVYTIDSVVSNLTFVVQYAPKVFTISMIVGRGGNVSATGINEITYGEVRTYTISTNKGYAIDYVMVNGEKIRVENNSFKISNVVQDTEIIIAFKKHSSIFDGAVGIYLIIFLVVMIVFAIAMITLAIIRKRQKMQRMRKMNIR